MPRKKPSRPSTYASFYSPRGIEAARDGIVDPVFGTLKDTPGGLFWRGHYDSPKFGKVVLKVSRGRSISRAQRDAFRLFTANGETIFKDAQEQLFEAYSRFLEGIEDDLFFEPEDFEQLTESKQIWGQIEEPFAGGTSLIVEYSRERTVFLRLAWNCTWDVRTDKGTFLFSSFWPPPRP